MRLSDARRLGGSAIETLRSSPDVLLAGGILSVLFVILVPLPPGLVDPLLILNVTLSVVVLLTAACVSRPLDFSVFPSLLLFTTFFRLALNIATTRLILGNAAEGQRAAGQVVLTFGGFVAGDNPIIGMIVFLVIVVVQFVVITKGATRVSEVAARFRLDAMPGKQMSVDGDLAAGLIDPGAARDKRQEVAHEADFYGAMDGASKFVRGDAVAGLVVVLINIAGGLAVGMAYHGMSLLEAVNVFSRLTIGDGLVSQLPALMVSLAAALLVTRSAASEHLGRDLGRQVLSNDGVLFVAAIFLLLLLPSGLPWPALLIGASACAVSGHVLRRERREREAAEPAFPEAQEPPDAPPAAPDDAAGPETVRPLLRIDPLVLEIGYGLLPLIDTSRGGNLVQRVADLREEIALDLGLVVPAVRVRDTRTLRSRQYAVVLRGHSLGVWECAPRGRLAVPRPGADPFPGEPPGRPGPPLGGLTTRWIEGEEDETAVPEDWRLLEPEEALVRHLGDVVRAHAAELLTRQEVARLLDDLRERAPSLVDEVVPSAVRPSDLQRVLQRVLAEGVSIRDLESILEALGSSGEGAQDTERAVERVRQALAREVRRPATGRDGKLHAVLLDPALEEFLAHSLENGADPRGLRLDPQTGEAIRGRTAEAVAASRRPDCHPALLCSPQLRPHLWRMVGGRVPGVSVLSYEEVPEESAVEVHGSVSLDVPDDVRAPSKEVSTQG